MGPKDKATKARSTLSKGGEASSATASASKKDVVSISDPLPPTLPLIPVSQTTLFPGMLVPVVVPEGKLAKSLEHVMQGSGYVGVVLHKGATEASGVGMGPSTSMTGIPVDGTVPATDEKLGDEFHAYGVAAKVLKRINLPDNQVSILLAGLQRFELKSLVSKEPFLVGAVNYLYEKVEQSNELEALLRSALSQFKQISKDNPLISEEMKVAMVNIDGPGKVADFMASVLVRDVDDYQHFLSLASVKARLEFLLVLLKKEHDVQAVQRKIQDEINNKVNSSQREFYLQEQLKYIQKELGKTADDRTRVIEKYRKRLDALKLSKDVAERIEDEMEKLESLPEQSSEYSVSLNYLDWATGLPWGVKSKDNYDLKAARRRLDKDHYGLDEVKERILEFLAVHKLKHSAEGSILCLVGPPGTGKTSLGKSIARVLGRKFFRFSVGGMRDEAEIKGHRRTYVGAMPGKLIQGMKRAGTQNPVFLIDEVDKLASGFHSGGDPAAALLELLDPEQNPEFLDHYLDIPFDCSQVFFITTANSTDSIPPALLDRMEVIQMRGYTDSEKYHIARQYLIPKQRKKNALKPSQIQVSQKALHHITAYYAREAGVRNLEKQIARLCRKAAFRVASGRAKKVEVETKADVERLLGLAPFTIERDLSREPGVATGLAWTSFGGEVLYVESTAVPGKGGFVLTGHLGDVMKESANLAFTYVRKQLKRLNLPTDYFEKNALHLHVPAGAIPKDGPSAGVTMVASLYSLLAEKSVDPGVAMTGEITLTGKVLPVGGIKEKVLAAKRVGRHTILLPRQNERDVREMEHQLRKGMKFLYVDDLDGVLRRVIH